MDSLEKVDKLDNLKTVPCRSACQGAIPVEKAVAH